MPSLESWIKHGEELRRPLIANGKLGDSEKVVIVGGGLSGLCCAYRIAQKRPDISVVIHERSNRLGGVINTWQDGEWICDLAVNATRPHPAFWRLIKDLGLSEKFSPSRPQAKSRWVLLNGKAHKLSWRTLFKIGPLKLRKALKNSRAGGRTVGQVIPHKPIADALCLGIVNDTSDNVDADFLLPSLTRFGENPPIKRAKLTKLIADSYPIFTPKRGSIASIDGGMLSLIDALVAVLSSLENVEIRLEQEAQSAQAVAQEYGITVESIIWAAPGVQDNFTESSLSIFAIGYRDEQVANVKVGYGTLIPDSKLPISGILHESDLHHSQRCPEGHRLFRLMVPHNRWDNDEQKVVECAEKLLAKDPVLFVKIGERKIPSYPPGYMADLKQLNNDCSYAGWSISGVSITHVVDEAERFAELF
jgi:protoporphyrinogen oxidase